MKLKVLLLCEDMMVEFLTPALMTKFDFTFETSISVTLSLTNISEHKCIIFVADNLIENRFSTLVKFASKIRIPVILVIHHSAADIDPAELQYFDDFIIYGKVDITQELNSRIHKAVLKNRNLIKVPRALLPADEDSVTQEIHSDYFKWSEHLFYSHAYHAVYFNKSKLSNRLNLSRDFIHRKLKSLHIS